MEASNLSRRQRGNDECASDADEENEDTIEGQDEEVESDDDEMVQSDETAWAQVSFDVPDLENVEANPVLHDAGPTGFADDVVERGSPLEYWQHFITPEMIEKIVENSNSFAQSFETLKKKKPITVIEILALVGIMMFMGITILPNRRMYWAKSGIFQNSFVSSVFTHRRFEFVLKVLHWIDTTKLSEAEKAENNRADKFWRVSSFCREVASKFRMHYNCGKKISVDEQCIPYKGRHPSKCYNPNKPNKWHFKVFSLNDSLTFYQSNFMLYQGKDEARPNNLTATEYPVYSLLNFMQYHHMNHVLATDNWYTSIALFVMLLIWGINSVGTIKTNRSGLPKQHLLPYKGKNVKPRGYMHQFRKKVTDNKFIYFTAWQDSKPVHLISTIKSYATTCKRNSKQNGRYVPLNLSQPTIIKEYNSGMGGTDGIDAKLEAYRTSIKTRAWPPKILFHVMQIAQVNAHICLRDSKDLVRKNKHFTLLSFSETLIEELVKPYRESRKQNDSMNESEDEEDESNDGDDDDYVPNEVIVNQPAKFQGSGWAKSSSVLEDGRLSGRHFARLHSKRRSCRICRINTPFYCNNPSCKQVFLCMKQRNSKKRYPHTCFEKFHEVIDSELVDSDSSSSD